MLRPGQLGELVAQAPDPLPLAEPDRIIRRSVVDVEDVLVPRLESQAAVQRQPDPAELLLVLLATLVDQLAAALEHPHALSVEDRPRRPVNWSSSRSRHRHPPHLSKCRTAPAHSLPGGPAGRRAPQSSAPGAAAPSR